MTALPFLQRPDSKSSEKKNYRLSLGDSEVKIWRCRSFLNDDETRTRSVIDNNANSQDVRRNRIFLANQADSDLQLIDRHYSNSPRSPQTVCRTPSTISRHRILHNKNSNRRGLPRWVSQLGRWLPPKQKLQLYQSFWKHLDLIDRNKEDMLDPFPHVVRCEHARTLSSLQRQRTRLKLEEECKEAERFERLLERFKKITEAWQAFQRQTAALGDEHTARLLAFKRTKDHYVDPLEGIRERREERERVERERQRLLEEAIREKELAKLRESVPSIVITNYDVDLMKLTQRQNTSSESETMEVDGSQNAINMREADSNEQLSNESDKSDKKSLNVLAAPSFSSLDVEDSVFMKNRPMLVDDTAGLMAGVVPVPLGISTGLIPDSSIRASSSCDRYHFGAQARLNNVKQSSKKGGAWCPKQNNEKQYLEVDLGGEATLMQVATQGYPGEEPVAKKDLRWVQSYTLAYSNDGKKWNSYREGGAVKIFDGNSDNNTVVLHSLSNPVDARYVRFCPKTWRNGIAMRVEVYGSSSDVCLSSPEAVNPAPASVSSPEPSSPPPPPTKDPSPPYSTSPKIPSQPSPSQPTLSQPTPSQPTPSLPTLSQPTPSQLTPSLPTPSLPTPSQPTPSLQTSSPPPVLPSRITKPPSPIFQIDEDVFELEQLKCSPDRMTPLEGWEEETVKSIAELPSEEEVEDVEVALISPFLNVQGSKTAKINRKPKKPKPEKKVKKKKKPPKKKKVKLPEITSFMDALPEVEEEEPEPDLEPEPEEEQPEPEELYRIPTPPLPEIPKRPVDVRPPSINKRFSMFSPQSTSPSEEERRKLARARADNSVRDELLRQQLAEERRKRLLNMTEKKKSPILSPSEPDVGAFAVDDDCFIFKYCIINDTQLGFYKRIFESFDEDEDGFLFPEEILEALECVNKNLLNDSHLKYIYRALELCDCSLESGADFKFFSVVAAFSQKIAALDDYAKILISKLNFRELDYKLQRAKSLYQCYADEKTGQMSMEVLTLELTIGGLDPNTQNHVLKSLGPTTTYLDFLDFLTYIPLFIHIHQHVLSEPLHVPVTIPVH